ncbi:MAG: membrane protein insertase YidC, partial [Gammaproteobacteria bacterium]|nr:membrane protein insertase YidC [Gammaproteobacteria bacterium]
MENQRLFLYLGLGFIMLLLYQQWMLDYGPQPVPVETTAQGAPAADGSPAAPAVVSEDLPQVPADSSQAVAAPSPDQSTVAPTGQRVTIKTDVFDAVIDTNGGSLVELTLTDYPVAVDQPDVPFLLLSDRPDRFLIAQSGLQGTEGVEAPNHKAVFSVAQDSYTLADGSETLIV